MAPIYSLAQLYLDGAAADLARSALPDAPVRPVAPPSRWTTLRQRFPAASRPQRVEPDRLTFRAPSTMSAVADRAENPGWHRAA